MSQAVKRACDACHRRKVKCDGINPCRNCSSAQLSCTYNAIPQKKGPKGSRAKVISELRETQRQTSLSAKVQSRMNGIPCPPTNPALGPTPGLLTSELVKDCAQFFFDNLYAQAPILDRRQVEQQVLYMEQNRDAYCLMTSLCAFVMLQPGMAMPPGDPYNLDMMPGANIISSQLLLEEAIRVRKGYDYLDSITLNALATNYFLFGCYNGQEMHDKAWYYLREATTMIHMIGMSKEEYYLQFDAAEATRRRRLYWLFFVTERAYAIQRQHPISLQATINAPTVADDPNDPQSHLLNGFVLLVNMYKPFDDTLTAVWNKTMGHLSTQYLSGLQKQLNELVQSYACQDAAFNDVQTNQQWLKNTFWQLTGRVGGNGDDAMSFQYPVHLSRELLVGMASQFPVQIDLLGPRLIEKLVQMTSSMTEFLSMQPPSRDPFAVGPREHLNQIISMVAVSRNGDHRFLPLLMKKLSELLPRTASPMLQDVPENVNMASIDIFDGFGNAGMAQPPNSVQMSMAGTDFDRKFSVEDYEKKYAMDMSGNTPESATNSTHSNASPPAPPQSSADMNGSFGSSPGLMSPAIDYPHGMASFGCPSIPDMVMSPMGNPTQSGAINASQGQQQHQHLGHGHNGAAQHMNGMAQQGMRASGLNTVMMAQPPSLTFRPPPQRQGSFQMQGQSQLRAGNEFHAFRGADSEGNALVSMGSMGGDLDFAMR